MFTLNTTEVHGVAYSIQGNVIDRSSAQNGGGISEDVSHTLTAADRHAVAYGVDCRNATVNREMSATIQAKPNGGISLNCTHPVLIVDEENDDPV